MRLLTAILGVFLSFSLLAQAGLVSGELSVTTLPLNNGDGTFSLVGNFNDPKGQFSAGDVAVGMSVWKGNSYLRITAASSNGTELTLTVNDVYSVGFIPTGIYSIGEETPRLQLPGVSTTGDSNPALNTPPEYAAKLNFILTRIDAAFPNVYEGTAVGDTTNVVAPVENDVFIAGDATLVYDGDQWLTIQANQPAQRGDTIFQSKHGYSVGQLVGQTAGNGPFFLAKSSDPDSFPVAIVVEVLDLDNFVIDCEGWIYGALPGYLPGRDYFLQSDGSIAPTPDTTNIFAFRTSTNDSTKIYADIPELVIIGGVSGGGGSGSSYTTTASNGLNDQDAGSDVDVELGGALERNTTITTTGYQFSLSAALGNLGAGVTLPASGQQVSLFARDVGTQETDVVLLPGFFDVEADTPAGDAGKMNITPSGIEFNLSVGGSIVAAMQILPDGLKLIGVTNYADDAAADADSSLPAGGIYTVTGDRSIRIKP